MNQLQAIITVEQLTKTFITGSSLFSTRKARQITAVDHVSFQVEKGEFLGYLGPNGAGKSTTMKMLTGLLVPTSGIIRANNTIPWKDRIRYVKNIGVVFGQKSTLWWDLPLSDSLDLIKAMYDIPTNIYSENYHVFNQLLELEEFIHKPIRTLSLGQRMRAELCAALIHNPTIVYLDEPTIGLDVVAKDRIRNFLKEINNTKGTTILLTTHDISDVEKLCRKIMIIDHGALIFEGELTGFAKKFGGKHRLIVDFDEDLNPPQANGAELVLYEGRRGTYEFDPTQVDISLLIQQITSQNAVHDIEIKKPEIEKIIRELYINGLGVNDCTD